MGRWTIDTWRISKMSKAKIKKGREWEENGKEMRRDLYGNWKLKGGGSVRRQQKLGDKMPKR